MIVDHVSNNQDTIFKSRRHKHGRMIMDDMSNNKVGYGTVENTNINNDVQR